MTEFKCGVLLSWRKFIVYVVAMTPGHDGWKSYYVFRQEYGEDS